MSKRTIGGQAVIEGVMMRGKAMYTLAVRQPDQTIYTEDQPIASITSKFPILKLPILRGITAFVESMVVGMKILSKSAEIAISEENEEPPSKFEQFLENKFGDRLGDVLIYVSVLFSLVIGTALFMLLPVAVSNLINRLLKVESWLFLSFLEGVIRIIIFLSYLYIVSRSKEIKRVFMYHGAEHKTINCFESGETLTVENVSKHTRLHKRCGTSFLLIVMVVSIFVFMFLRTNDVLQRFLLRIALVPVIAGLSYEIIRWAGKSDSSFVNFISKPGLLLQQLTTAEPTGDQIEVAIAAVKGVLESEPEV